MSMQTDCIYGIGFQIKIKPDQLQKFLQDHKESIEQIKGTESVLDCLDKERNLTKDELIAMFKKYAKELDSNIEVDEDIRLEYYD